MISDMFIKTDYGFVNLNSIHYVSFPNIRNEIHFTNEVDGTRYVRTFPTREDAIKFVEEIFDAV